MINIGEINSVSSMIQLSVAPVFLLAGVAGQRKKDNSKKKKTNKKNKKKAKKIKKDKIK